MSPFAKIKRSIAEGRIEFGMREAIVLALIGIGIAVGVALVHL